MLAQIVNDLDPVIVRLGPLQIRYYGLVFAATLYAGYMLWRWQMARGGHSQETADRIIVPAVVGVVAGARLGHFLFYRPMDLITNPLEVLWIHHGGLASHGAAIGIAIALVWFARKQKLPVLEVSDRFSFSIAAGAAGIRLGNFLNSEIVGRPTEIPWGVRFMHYDGGVVARHPSQLYEFAMGLAVLGLLYYVDRRFGRETRPLGLMTGTVLAAYFLGRFVVEFFKERHVLHSTALSMGQILSVAPFVAGVIVIVWSLRRTIPAARPAGKKKR